jgi:hypothetical protein
MPLSYRYVSGDIQGFRIGGVIGVFEAIEQELIWFGSNLALRKLPSTYLDFVVLL